jgi:hypothetical protein
MVDGCFHYGTLMTDNYGDSLFFPSTNAIERAIHPDICPEDGSAFGK